MSLFGKKEVIESSRKYSEYLPVGTIIKLYNDNNKYMIRRYFGNRCMAFKHNNVLLKKSKVYSSEKSKRYNCVDYEICDYPGGFDYWYIMHDDICEIVYLGYDDEYRKNILNEIDRWSYE